MDKAYMIAVAAMTEIESGATEAQQDENIVITRMSDVVEQPIDWLWPKRIACGKLTVIAGNPGLGKSQVTSSMAAIISKGFLWPDYAGVASVGSVIFLSAEDNAADTIKPRLRAAQADTDKCYVLEAIKIKTQAGKDSERTFDLTRDIESLSNALKKIGDVRLVVIDPITAYLGKTDSHNNADMRGVLAPLAAVAAKHNVAVLLVTHLNKAQGQDMLSRISGSIGLVAAARAGYAVVKDQGDPNRRYFLPVKNNIGNDSDGLGYSIEAVTLDNGIATSRIVWNPVPVSAHSIFNPSGAEEPIIPDPAVEWLRDLLTEKPVSAKKVAEEWKAAGFTAYQIKKAKEVLKILPRKQGVANGEWVWALPDMQVVEEIEEIEENVGPTHVSHRPIADHPSATSNSSIFSPSSN